MTMLPPEWWKQGDLRAGGTGLKGLQFTPDMFSTWGKPQYADWAAMGDSDAKWIDPWHSEANPLYAGSNGWSNYTFEQDPTTGEMSLVVKSGGKEGTRYKMDGSLDKGFTVGDPTETFGWNTNTPGTYYLQALAPILGATGAGLLSELGNLGSAGMAAGEGAMIGSGLSSVGDLVGAAGVGGAGAAGGGAGGLLGAADGIANAGWGLEHAATGAGMGGMAGGAWSTPGLTSVANAWGGALPAITNAATGAAPTYVNSPTTPPGTTMTGKDLLDYAKTAGTVASGANAAKNLLTGGDGQRASGTNYEGLLDILLKGVDAYNKRSTGDKMVDWADKLYGKSTEFEDMLMKSFADPSSWLEGPEGQALKRITENQLLRTDSRIGNLSNDTARTKLLQDHMMQGLNNYRSQVRDSAGLGRNASAVAAKLMTEGETMKDGFLSPFTFQSGKSGGGSSISGIINDLRAIGGVAKDFWDWLDDTEIF